MRDPKCGENRWALICEVKNLRTHSEFPLGSLQDIYKKIIKDHVRSCKISNQGLSGSVGDRNRAAVRNLSLSQDPSNISPQGSSHISAKSPQNFRRHVPTGVLWLSARAIPNLCKIPPGFPRHYFCTRFLQAPCNILQHLCAKCEYKIFVRLLLRSLHKISV